MVSTKDQPDGDWFESTAGATSTLTVEAIKTPFQVTFSDLGSGSQWTPIQQPTPGQLAGDFQAKYTVPVGDSGIQVPISFRASNRTELIKERELLGSIGITFDLDKLLVKK